VTATVSTSWPRRLTGSRDVVHHRAHDVEHGQLRLPRDDSERRALLDEIERTGLRGRGGAGFPVARKMRAVAAGKTAVVVANGCEGEPGSDKDAYLLSAQPHLVLDGIALAAAAVGADEAHLAIHRGSLVLPVLRRALAERPGGEPKVQLHTVPARYVASEESALVQFLNGGEAKPTFTPPRPFERGVGRRPTLVYNVETLAHVALIARRGADWFRSVGDSDEPGTLLITVTGSAGARTVVEVPTGTRIGEVLAATGTDLNDCSAVLVGGYFGTWMTAEQASHLPLTHRDLSAAGGALGAGILIALSRDACGLAETSHVLDYLASQSAGQCGPCLNGLPSVAHAYGRLARGGWDERLGAALDRWLTVVPGRGVCRHPDGALRLMASSFPVFAEDVGVHRAGRPCTAAHRPPALPIPVVNPAEGWR
jgi:NADH:ubiquinone oxidoreductase subunit F (NADH-binding)